MKRSLVIALGLAVAVPAISLTAAPAEAQVLTGRNAATRNAPRPLSERELNRLYEAEDLVFELDTQIAEIRADGEAAGGLTDAQRAQIAELTRRRDDAQRTIDRLERKRDR